MDCMKTGFEEGFMLDGRYESVSPLNNGSFGMVFLARDLVDGGLVAIKCLSKTASKDYSNMRSDDNSMELKCHERLGQHPNLVNLIYSFDTQAHLYLVLEYCSMGDLYEAIRLGRGPLETENVREFMFQLISAVNCMHSNGLFHRDIKPENIFLCHNGSMKLGDLGLATDDSWSHEVCVGSDRYMAPEQYDPPEVGYSPAKADIWAIGICLLNILFSRNPFVIPTESDKLFSDFARDPQSLFDIFPNMSQDTFDVLVHAMAIDPVKRSLSAVRLALEKVANFTTDGDLFDDFCTEAREVAPAAANREPLRTPSISSPHIDQGGAFPWSKALQTSPHTRQLSVIPDTESCTEDLFPVSEKDRNSWYSVAQNSSVTSGLDSHLNASFGSMMLNAPAPRHLPRSKPFRVPSSLPARITSLSSVFGKKDALVPQSWSEIWDEDEEHEFNESEVAIEKRHEHNSRTWSHDSNIHESTPHDSWVSEPKNLTLKADLQDPAQRTEHQPTADGVSEHEVFIFEEPGSHDLPLSKHTLTYGSLPSKPCGSVFDKWTALGNRRRQFNQETQVEAEASRKRTTAVSSWRSGFGFKVLAGHRGWDRANERESTFAKVRDWRRDAASRA